MKKYLLFLTAQLLFSVILAFGIYLIKPLTGLHKALLWILFPLASGISAFALSEKGLNAYVCWFLPPLMLVLAAYIVTGGYLPSGAAVLLTSVVGIIGAAAGENYNRFRTRKYK